MTSYLCQIYNSFKFQAHILDKDVDTFDTRLESFINDVNEADRNFHKELVNVSRVHGVGRIRHQELRTFRASIKDIMNSQDEIASVIKDNSELLTQFQNLANSVSTDNKLDLEK